MTTSSSGSVIVVDSVGAYTALHQSADAPAPRHYVMIVTQPLMQIHKDCLVLVTSAPMRAVALRNIQRRTETRNDSLSVSHKAAYLYPVFVAGPFFSADAGIDFADQLVVGKRGLASKVRHGCDMAARLGLECYMSDRELSDDALERCTADWPDDYRHTLERVKSASDVLVRYVTHDSLDRRQEEVRAEAIEKQWLAMVVANTAPPPPVAHAVEHARAFWKRTKFYESIEECSHNASAAAIVLGLAPVNEGFAERHPKIARFLRRHRHRRNELVSVGHMFEQATRNINNNNNTPF